QKHLDFFQQSGKEIFFLQAGGHIFAAIYRAISGNDNDRNFRVPLMDLASEFHAVHSVHAKIGDQNVEIFFVEFFESIVTAISAHGAITLHLQDFAAQSCQHLMVIDE